MRKTKIISTLGPASNNEQILEQLMRAGADVFRFNFSHSNHEGHKETFEKVVRLREQLGLNVATLLDTRGPEVRVKTFANGSVQLSKGNTFILSTKDGFEGDENRVSITYNALHNDLTVGQKVLLDDGAIELKVTDICDGEISCLLMNSGILKNNKGINIPGIRLSMPYISEKDSADIRFGAELGFDFIAASFVRCPEDVLQIRKLLSKDSTIRIISKIENADGVENIDQILKVSDGIMIARGDLGVEIPLEEVPIIQKELIKKAYEAGKQVITATQMLESMINNPRPTRAESTDVANAIYDGTSAIMLSGETAAGAYPVLAVQTMATIAERTEQDIDYKKRFYNRESIFAPSVTNAISHATCTTAYDLGATAIITATETGTTARMISKYRPSIPIIGCSSRDTTLRGLNMSWGVCPLKIEEQEGSDELFDHCVKMAKSQGLVDDGDIIVITAGIPLGIAGTTNILKVAVVGDILIKGMPINKITTQAPLCVAESEQHALDTFRNGDILVISETSNNILNILKKASGIITEQDGANSHAAIVGMSLDIPVIVGAENATKILKSGTVAKIDGEKGYVSV